VKITPIEMSLFRCEECGMFIAVDEDHLEPIFGTLSCPACGALDNALEFINPFVINIRQEMTE